MINLFVIVVLLPLALFGILLEWAWNSRVVKIMWLLYMLYGVVSGWFPIWVFAIFIFCELAIKPPGPSAAVPSPSSPEVVGQIGSETGTEEEPRKKALRRLHVGLVSLYVVKLRNQLDAPKEISNTEAKK